MNTHIEDLICEHVNEQFAYINYGRFERVLIFKSNNYVNLTKFVKTFSKKEFYSWRQNASSRDLVDELFKELNSISREEYAQIESSPSNSESTKTTIIEPLMDILHVPNELKGTYGHPIILNAVAMWISAEYAIYVHKLIIKWTVQDKDHRISELELLRRDINKNHQELKENHQQLLERHEVTISMLEDAETSRDNSTANNIAYLHRRSQWKRSSSSRLSTSL
jgi:hypothetical protein